MVIYGACNCNKFIGETRRKIKRIQSRISAALISVMHSRLHTIYQCKWNHNNLLIDKNLFNKNKNKKLFSERTLQFKVGTPWNTLPSVVWYWFTLQVSLYTFLLSFLYMNRLAACGVSDVYTIHTYKNYTLQKKKPLTVQLHKSSHNTNLTLQSFKKKYIWHRWHLFVQM